MENSESHTSSETSSSALPDFLETAFPEDAWLTDLRQGMNGQIVSVETDRENLEMTFMFPNVVHALAEPGPVSVLTGTRLEGTSYKWEFLDPEGKLMLALLGLPPTTAGKPRGAPEDEAPYAGRSLWS